MPLVYPEKVKINRIEGYGSYFQFLLKRDTKKTFYLKVLSKERKKLKMISKRLILFNDPSVLNQLNSNNLPMEENNEHK